MARETIELLRGRDGDLVREHVITDVVGFDDAAAFIEDLLARRRDFLQVVFRMAGA